MKKQINDMDERKLSYLDHVRMRPAYALVIILLSSFLIEITIMQVMERLTWLSAWQATLLDGFSLTITLFPAFYYLLFLPLQQRIIEQANHQRRLQRLMEELRHAKDVAEAATQDLMEREGYLRSILEHSLDAIITTDLHGRVVEFNAAAERLFGYAREDVLEKLVDELIIPPAIRSRHRIAMARWSERTSREGGLSRRFDVSAQRADGTLIEIQLSLTLVSNMGECHFTAFIQDITDRKQLLVSLHEALLAAESSNKAKSEFLANMSHEIRTPMNGMLGMIDLALGSGLPDKVREFLSHAKSSSHLLLRVINDILDYSRIESGKLQMEEVTFYLGDILADAVNLFRQTAFDRNLELVVAAPPQSIGQLVGDRLRIQQILVNLVGNAVKFTQTGGIYLKVVVVEQAAGQVRLEFSVKDTGIGLTTAQIAGLFAPFVQADSSITRKFGGTGLGLTICKRLVEMMGGEIWVSSVPQVGSIFYFTVVFGLNPHLTPYCPLLPDDLRGLRVLVVDDHQDARLVVTEMLGYLQLDATAVESGQKCLEALQIAARKGTPYALVFVDWQMPEMNGLETVQHIAASALATTTAEYVVIDRPKVIMMTSFGREDIIKHTQQVGVDACLIKPMTPALLLDTILDVFGKTVTKVYAAPEDGLDQVAVIRHVGGAHVLLVEDNSINQRVAHGLLTNVGVMVTLASHGQEALRLLADKRFDLVFMDVQMPVLDGYQATRQLRSMPQFRDLPIIAMTAHALAGDRANCLAAGMNDYISKPIDLQHLLRILIRWIKPQDGAQQGHALLVQALERTESSVVLADVPGIHVQSALARLGTSSEFYQQLWGDFRRDYQQAAEEIRTALLVTGDQIAAHRQVHSIKGVAGSLGAQELSVAADNLVAGIVDNRRAEWVELLDTFAQALEQVLQSVVILVPDSAIRSPISSATPAMAPVDREAVMPHLTTMAHWLRKGNVKAIESVEPLRQLLSGTPLQQQWSAVERAMDQFAMGEARQHLEVITTQLQQLGEES